jgi:septal ring factor EnvC (AmiA/AmiB activator)
MAKKVNINSSSPDSAVDEQKKRKKQAKREAKVMLEIEETKASIQQVEKKLAKAQVKLGVRNAHLRTLETDLSELRTSQEETEVSAPDAGFDHQTGQPEPEEITVNSNQQDTVSSNQEP